MLQKRKTKISISYRKAKDQPDLVMMSHHPETEIEGEIETATERENEIVVVHEGICHNISRPNYKFQ